MHAVAVLTAYAVSLVLNAAWPVSVGAGLSLLALIASAAGRWTPTGGFGPANLITLFRLALLLAVAAALPLLGQNVPFVALLAAFLLDAVDGVVARRFGCASEFGAIFDCETDATLVVVLGLVLWLRRGVGEWVLVPGTLRYAYVLILVLAPPTGVAAQRSRFGRRAFLTSTTLFLGALLVGGIFARTLAAALASAIVGASFTYSFMQSYPRPWRLPRSMLAAGQAAWRYVSPTLFFLLAWSFLNLMVNVRYPATEPTGWYFLPSLDVTLLLALFALLGLAGWRLPWGARIPIVALFVLIRGLRIGDGVTGRYFGKLFNLYIDLPLAPDLVRYAHSTFAAWKFYAGVVGALAVVGLLVLAVDRAVAFSAAYLQRRRRVLLLVALAMPFAIASAFLDQDPRYNERYAGAFAASTVPRLQREATFLLNVYDHRLSGMRNIARTQDVLNHTPSHLERLHHANVYLIFVESYGATVLDRPSFAEKALPALKAMQSDLDRHGFASASGLMESATYGGMSWLAHATLLTGVRTTDQLQYDLLGVSHPRSMARLMHDTGYYTTMVEPNTNRPSPTADFYDFDRVYRNWDFDYAGPAFAWASMPDQYVMDYARRNVLAKRTGPLFVTYVLVSSHAPWSHIPTMVEDWSQIGDGSIYNTHPLKRAHTNWPDFSNAAEPYLTSILYDLQVLDDYLTIFVDDDSLFVILGDHQPVSEITDNSPSWAVPVHVISRDPSLVAPFVARGYTTGMIPSHPTSPMESFLVDFLRDFSSGST